MNRDGMMSALAAMDQYNPVNTFAERFPETNWTHTPPPDANEVAAMRLARPYAKANAARMQENHPVAELALGMAPTEPWQYGLMFAGPGASWAGRAISQLPRAARVMGATLGFGLTADEAKAKDRGKSKMGGVADQENYNY